MFQLSLVHAESGRPQIQYKVGKGRRQTLRLGPCSHTIALAVKQHVREMLLAKLFNRSAQPETEAWLLGIDDGLYAKFAKHDLVAPRTPAAEQKTNTVVELADYCIALWFKSREGSRSAGIYRNARENLRTYFRLACHRCHSLTANDDHCQHCGEPAPDGDCSWPIDQITAGHADEFVDWLFTEGNPRQGTGGYAPQTANKRILHARRFFRQACRLQWIETNPFADIKAAPEAADDKKFHVSREIIDKLMEFEPNAQFRLVVALARFAGLRSPSEMGPLRRDWVEGQELLVYTTKLAHLPSKRWRKVPIFPEIQPYLDAVLAEPAEPESPLLNALTCSESALTSRLKKLCHRAGIPLWKKPWVNMRSTRITELEDSKAFSEAALDAWFGNTQAVRKKHYNQVTKEQLERALSGAWGSDSF